ncbi:MAG: O-antigen ligase family protein [Pseudomonadaceae bacterium]|nr:O-antigen ligase family protein [Pseudomonadaceae bacterium]
MSRTLTLSLPSPAACTRAVLLVFTLLLPVLYDLTVPEVAGDIRWTWTHLAAALAVGLGLWGWWENKTLKLTLRQPVIFWWATLLALWAALSMVDSISFDRGIVLIKAMYAQLMLMVVAYLVASPAFAKRLAWTMALPLGFCAFLGICQFFAWNDQSFKLVLLNTTGLGWLGDVWPSGGIITPMVGYFMQSAVPGSTFANKNLAGSYTVMMLPIAGYVLVSARSIWARGVASFLLAIGSLFLVYSRSRASWVALVVGLVAVAVALVFSPVWRAQLRAGVSRRGLALWLLPTILALAAFGSATSPVKGAHAVDRTPLQQVEALAKSSRDEIGGRLAYNLNSLVITKDYWFNGVGLGAFFNIYPAYHDAIVSTPPNSYTVMARPQRTHTDLMQAFAEMGIVGGIAYASLLLSALWMAWRLGRDAVAGEAGLFPLFAGWALLNVSINALMDFPMQLPTAPALAALLMGLLAAQYVRAYPQKVWGFNLTLAAPRTLLPLAAVAWAAIFGWALWDDYKFRQGNQILKAAMVRIYSGVTDDETLRLVNLAQATYPWDPRIQEHVAVTYANYKGNKPMPLETRIDTLEWMLDRDPWGPNHLVNTSGQYLQLAEYYMGQGNRAAADKLLARVDELFARLQRVAGFSHFTWGIGGMLNLLRGNNAVALEMLERAVKIDPNYAPAINGINVARARLASPSS